VRVVEKGGWGRGRGEGADTAVVDAACGGARAPRTLTR